MNCRFLPVDQRHLREAWSIREDPIFEAAPELGDQFRTLDASAVCLAALACERLGLDPRSLGHHPWIPPAHYIGSVLCRTAALVAAAERDHIAVSSSVILAASQLHCYPDGGFERGRLAVCSRTIERIARQFPTGEASPAATPTPSEVPLLTDQGWVDLGFRLRSSARWCYGIAYEQFNVKSVSGSNPILTLLRRITHSDGGLRWFRLKAEDFLNGGRGTFSTVAIWEDELYWHGDQRSLINASLVPPAQRQLDLMPGRSS